MQSVKGAASGPVLALVETQFASPAENLACDEALLEYCEAAERESNSSAGFMRFWESSAYFVVLGYAKHLEREVFRDECNALGIQILRRCSGGGTVLQGPGCLNYTLILPIAADPEFENITGANRSIMERNRQALAGIAQSAISIQGHTDLVIDGRKFSGNAQRRKRRYLLFHGSFLLDFDLPLIARTLRAPAQQPEYRAQRDHLAFLANWPMPRSHVKAALLAKWNAVPNLDCATITQLKSHTEELARVRYAQQSWNERF